MLNIVEINAAAAEHCKQINSCQDVNRIFSEAIINELGRFKSNQIDNLIIRGLPVPHDLPNTPIEIRQQMQSSFPVCILKSIAEFLGQISEKGIEHTIRFRANGRVNEETWHGHYQYRYSVFYCLRGDPEARTYFFSANQLVRNAPPEVQTMLLRPKLYMAEKQAFSLIVQEPTGYRISEHIYDRSDFEKYIKDLDLPDVVKALKKLSPLEPDDFKTVGYLLRVLQNPDECISYKAGDIALYNESSTMRFSPSYTPSTEEKHDRWILSLSVKR